MNLYIRQKQTHRQKTNLWLPKGKCWGQEGSVRSLGLTETHDYT